VRSTWRSTKAHAPQETTLEVNGRAVPQRKPPRPAALLFTANDCLDIGTDLGSPVSPDCYDHAPFAFDGTIEKVHVSYVQ
jgi:hypothetical protein